MRGKDNKCFYDSTNFFYGIWKVLRGSVTIKLRRAIAVYSGQPKMFSFAHQKFGGRRRVRVILSAHGVSDETSGRLSGGRL
jgi:hypothetical protein